MNIRIPSQMFRWAMLLLVLLMMGFALAACGGDEEATGDSATSSSSSGSEATASGPLKFIYFFEDGCDACTRMEPIVKALEPDYKDVLTVESHDAKSDEGKKLMEQYELKKTPSYVIADGSGSKLWSNAGEIHKDMLRQQIKALTGK